MRLRLPLPPNFHFDAIVRSHGWYDLPPFAYDARRSILTTSVADRSRAIPIAFHSKQGKLEVISEAIERRRLVVIATRVFSLNIHLEESVSAFSGDGNLTRALARGGGRMLRAPTVFEDAVKVLFTTNCSWEATRGMVARLIALSGD